MTGDEIRLSPRGVAAMDQVGAALRDLHAAYMELPAELRALIEEAVRPDDPDPFGSLPLPG